MSERGLGVTGTLALLIEMYMSGTCVSLEVSITLSESAGHMGTPLLGVPTVQRPSCMGTPLPRDLLGRGPSYFTTAFLGDLVPGGPYS